MTSQNTATLLKSSVMNRTAETSFEPAITGNCLIEPIQWYGRSISQLFTKPLQEEPFFAAIEVVVRIIAFVALVLIAPLLLLVTSAALIGWVFTFCPQRVEAKSEIPLSSDPSIPPLSAEQAEQICAAAAFFVPPTPEIVEAARRKSTELVTVYNRLKVLNENNILRLMGELTEFTSLYEKHRDPDRSNVDDMTKIFNTIDALASNTVGLQNAFRHWVGFYRVQADQNEVVAQSEDGNCWLHTAILGLHHINHLGIGDDTHETLRPKVVDWMLKNYKSSEKLRGYVTDAIEAHKAAEKRSIEEYRDSLTEALKENLIPLGEEQHARETLQNYEKSLKDLDNFSVDDYFKHIKIVGSHGSHAELYAISRMFQVNIAIWRDLPAHGNEPSRLTKEFDEQIEHPQAIDTINAVLTQQGNHFNYRLPPAV